MEADVKMVPGKYEKIILRLISAVLVVAMINMIYHADNIKWSELEMVSYISNISLILSCVAVFLIITVFDVILKNVCCKNIDAWIFTIVSVSMGMYMLISEKNIYMTLMVVMLVIIAIRYVLLRFKRTLIHFEINNFTKKSVIIFVLAATLIYVGSLVVLRYYLFRTPTFDFGIFSQMYYYMKETGLPYTTCERGYYLSHFAVHISPVFYLILPIYMIFPSPVTLIIVQLLIVMSGAVPVYLMCKNKKHSNFFVMGLVVLFLLYPTMRSGLFYDFHENKFLPPLLLWLLYFLDNEALTDKKRNAGIITFSLLSLMVKEDAPIYVACIGLFWLAYKKPKKEKIRGAIIFVAAVIYFIIVFNLLGKYGEGKAITSIGRYNNLIFSQEDGIIGLVINVIKNPAYVINQLMTKEKLEFVLWTMLPLMFTPLLVRRTAMYILAVPYLVINLLTNYGYQFDIGFQYTYGSCTLLIYMTILWFEGNEGVKKKMYMIFMLVASLLCSTNALAGKNTYYTEADISLERNFEILELFESIPEENTVKASTWFVPALSQRKEIYDIEKEILTDFIVYDMRSEQSRQTNMEKIEEMRSEGYEIFGEIENGVTILRKKN